MSNLSDGGIAGEQEEDSSQEGVMPSGTLDRPGRIHITGAALAAPLFVRFIVRDRR